jgi:predicted dehydrogenase
MRRVLRMAMVGGGPGSFIGPVHRMAAELDGGIKMVAGAFSRDEGRAQAAGRSYGVQSSRSYADYMQLIKGERHEPDGADFVAIVTPNNSHFPIARAALENGFHVISDKPATATIKEAIELAAIVNRASRLYALTYTYTGYPLVREARELCRRREFGEVRKVVVGYTQGWLSESVELSGQRQAAWRTDPAQAGPGGCVSDIGVHAFNLLEYVTNLQASEVCADLSALVKGRTVDDDCNVLLRLDNGARAVLHSTQVAAGERNRLQIRVHCEHGSIAWDQETPNILEVAPLHRPAMTLHAGEAYLSPIARAAGRLPSGHPEGYIEAFANIYRDFAADVKCCASGRTVPLSPTLCGIDAGLRGMRFVEAAIASSRGESKWIRLNG